MTPGLRTWTGGLACLSRKRLPGHDNCVELCCTYGVGRIRTGSPLSRNCAASPMAGLLAIAIRFTVAMKSQTTGRRDRREVFYFIWIPQVRPERSELPSFRLVASVPGFAEGLFRSPFSNERYSARDSPFRRTTLVNSPCLKALGLLRSFP
jgi:hypothetical protein